MSNKRLRVAIQNGVPVVECKITEPSGLSIPGWGSGGKGDTIKLEIETARRLQEQGRVEIVAEPKPPRRASTFANATPAEPEINITEEKDGQ